MGDRNACPSQSRRLATSSVALWTVRPSARNRADFEAGVALRRLENGHSPRHPSTADRAGLASFSLAIVAMLAAAAISAFVTPLVPELFGSNAHAAPTGHSLSSIAATNLGLFSWLINQAFARFYVTLASLAILFWAFAWRRDDVLNQAIAVLGIAVGGGILLWQLSGQFQPRPGPMMFVAAGHAGWFVLAAARLLASPDPSEQSNA